MKAFGVTAGQEQKKSFCAPEIVGYVGIIIYYLIVMAVDGNYIENRLFGLLACIVGVFLAELFVYVFTFPKYQAEQIASAVFSFLYAPVMLSFIDFTRMLDKGIYLVWLVLICSWGSDTCAYCVGMLIGKHKMSPVLSPKKSIEGAIGGVVGAALLGGIYAAVVGAHLEAENPIITYAVICAVGALISMVGDLAASAIKRNHDIKDYGKLIPGHGGILDRFDSVIFTAPVIYFLSQLMFLKG